MDSSRHAKVLQGRYWLNRFVGELARAHSLSSGELDALPVFIHEYWHYLQNISTRAGLSSFALNQALLALFSKTLSPPGEGTSAGSESLSDEDQRQVLEIVKNLEMYRGELGPIGRDGRNDLTCRVLDFDGDVLTVDVIKYGSRVATEDFHVGAPLIEESIAYLVDTAVAQAIGVVPPPAPEFPYRILERIVAWSLDGQDEQPLIIAALGTLALLTRAPAGTLRRITALYRKARIERNEEPASALKSVANDMLPSLYEELEQASNSISIFEDMHKGRGLSERAMIYIAGQMRKALARRKDDPLFDLRPLINGISDASDVLDHIRDLLKEFEPCDFVIKGDSGHPDEVLTFSLPQEDEHGLELPQYLRSFHLQQQFMMAHLHSQGFVRSDKVPPERARCPFASACSHPLRQENESLCMRAPWEHLKSPTPGCWYTNGVSATMGLVKFKKMGV